MGPMVPNVQRIYYPQRTTSEISDSIASVAAR